MLKSFVTITEEENREMEKWAQKNFNKPHDTPADILLLILYRIHLPEQEITIIKEQAGTHWADRVDERLDKI